MTDILSTQMGPSPNVSPGLPVPAGQDRFGEFRSIGIGSVDFKVTAQDNRGIFIVEIKLHTRGGPAKHLHYDQDEYFYILEGEFLFEVGEQRMRLNAGDSIFGPRRIPHVWAFAGEASGRILFTFTPPGQMEAFFSELTKTGSVATADTFSRHGMQYVGPPLKV